MINTTKREIKIVLYKDDEQNNMLHWDNKITKEKSNVRQNHLFKGNVVEAKSQINFKDNKL